MEDKMGMLAKLMASKKMDMGDEEMDPMLAKAKMSVLKDLHKHMGNMMGDDMMGLKKVTVAAPDSEGLKKGLDKAEEMLPSNQESPEMKEEMPEAELSEESLSPEEIEAKIEELKGMLVKKQMKV